MAFEFKIKLEGSSNPPIWRKVKLSSKSSFHEFHIVIQAAFGWGNCHLYQFCPKGWGSYPVIGEKMEDPFDDHEYLTIEDWPNGECFDSMSITLKDYFHTPKQQIIYIYDFGDDWRHKIELAAITGEDTIVPVCTGGKGKCPPEDCGAIWGYYALVETVNNPKYPDHKQMREWLDMEKGEKWDVNEFDLQKINEKISDEWEYREG